MTPNEALKETVSFPGRVTGLVGERVTFPFNGADGALQSVKLKPYRPSLLCITKEASTKGDRD